MEPMAQKSPRDWSLLWKWALATVVGGIVGGIAAGGLGALLSPFFLVPVTGGVQTATVLTWLIAFQVGAGLLVGAGIGLGQWLVLRRRVPQAGGGSRPRPLGGPWRWSWRTCRRRRSVFRSVGR